MAKLHKGRLIVKRNALTEEAYEAAIAKRRVVTFSQYPSHIQRKLINVKKALVKFFNVDENATFLIVGEYV